MRLEIGSRRPNISSLKLGLSSATASRTTVGAMPALAEIDQLLEDLLRDPAPEIRGGPTLAPSPPQPRFGTMPAG
jgi:hypothetical protein